MLAIMLKLLSLFGWRKRHGDVPEDPDRARAVSYGDALDAGWVPAPPEAPAGSGTAMAPLDERLDVESTLARYYPNQDC